MSTDEHRRTRSTGRTLGLTVFWLMAAYVVGAASLSIIPSLYFPDYAPRPEHTTETACAAELQALWRQLDRQSSRALAGAPTPGDWAGDWDRRYGALGDCGSLESTRQDLGILRRNIESMLQTFQRDQVPVRKRIERALDSWTSIAARAPGEQ